MDTMTNKKIKIMNKNSVPNNKLKILANICIYSSNIYDKALTGKPTNNL